MEETCLTIEPQQILFVDEFVDRENRLHKVEIYYSSVIKLGKISSNCKDKGGFVSFAKFFSIEEIRSMHNIAPKFLKDGEWQSSTQNIYRGMRIK